MSASLTLHALDDSRFPELEREPGVYGIEPKFIQPGADARIAAPKGSAAVLLVSYTLLLSQAPFGSRWQLQALGLSPDGKERRSSWALEAPAPRRDHVEPITPDGGVKPHPGSLDRGVFWVDLGPLLANQSLRAGDPLTLRYGNASVGLVVPGAPRR